SSARAAAQHQASVPSTSGGDQTPATPPDVKTNENDDLDKIPNAQSSGDAEAAASRNENQRAYVENVFIGSTGRSALAVPVRSTASTWQDRVFVDVRREWHAGRRLTLAFGDRLNVRAENDLAFPTKENVINEWREGFVSWEIFDSTYIDAGRINLKSGAALGFNPTDFF